MGREGTVTWAKRRDTDARAVPIQEQEEEAQLSLVESESYWLSNTFRRRTPTRHTRTHWNYASPPNLCFLSQPNRSADVVCKVNGLDTRKHWRRLTELEALGVVWAVNHFRPYLYGHKCQVVTDHEALKSLLNTPHPSGKLARWRLAIQEQDQKLRYCPGRVNQATDTLSHLLLQTLLSRNQRAQSKLRQLLHPLSKERMERQGWTKWT